MAALACASARLRARRRNEPAVRHCSGRPGGVRTPPRRAAGATPSPTLVPGAGIPANAAANVTRSVADLAAAARAIAQAQAAQSQANAAALAMPGNVPNGLAAGDLQVDPRVPSNPAFWQGAALPTQAVAGGRTTVTVTQEPAGRAAELADGLQRRRPNDARFQPVRRRRECEHLGRAEPRERSAGQPSRILGSIARAPAGDGAERQRHHLRRRRAGEREFADRRGHHEPAACRRGQYPMRNCWPIKNLLT